MSLATVARAIMVALIASVSAGAPMIALLTWDMDSGPGLGLGLNLFVLALLGNFLIGLPIALLTYWRIRDRQDVGLWHLIGLANLVAGLFLIVLFGSVGAFGLIFYGIPIAISANVFAIAGWFVVLGSERSKT